MATYDEQLRSRLRQLGARVRTERERLGLSQEDLAHRAGLHRTYVGAVERGERNITLGSTFSLADALGIRVGDLTRSESDQGGTGLNQN